MKLRRLLALAMVASVCLPGAAFGVEVVKIKADADVTPAVINGGPMPGSLDCTAAVFVSPDTKVILAGKWYERGYNGNSGEGWGWNPGISGDWLWSSDPSGYPKGKGGTAVIARVSREVIAPRDGLIPIITAETANTSPFIGTLGLNAVRAPANRMATFIGNTWSGGFAECVTTSRTWPAVASPTTLEEYLTDYCGQLLYSSTEALLVWAAKPSQFAPGFYDIRYKVLCRDGITTTKLRTVYESHDTIAWSSAIPTMTVGIRQEVLNEPVFWTPETRDWRGYAPYNDHLKSVVIKYAYETEAGVVTDPEDVQRIFERIPETTSTPVVGEVPTASVEPTAGELTKEAMKHLPDVTAITKPLTDAAGSQIGRAHV